VAGWGLKLEVLRLLVALTLNWRRVAQRHMPGLLQRCWAQFTACAGLYERAVVRGEQDLDEGEVRPCCRAFFQPLLQIPSYCQCYCDALKRVALPVKSACFPGNPARVRQQGKARSNDADVPQDAFRDQRRRCMHTSAAARGRGL
jgi:hypothetical protein